MNSNQPPYDSMPQQPQAPAPQPGGQQPQFYAPAVKKDRSWIMIALVGVLVILFIAAGSVAIWSYMNYQEASTNLRAKEDKAALKAQKDQSDADEIKFSEREKQPFKQFAGPDNYGRVTFQYPKTWSVYVSSDVASNGGTYSAFLNPGVVPPTESDTQRFALRLTIEQTDYSTALQQYQPQIEIGKLKSSSFSANGHSGTRLDGSFDESYRGSAVVLQIRDKVLTIRTDANTFKGDFNRLVKTIDFNN